jgi:Polysaccharide lyase
MSTTIRSPRVGRPRSRRALLCAALAAALTLVPAGQALGAGPGSYHTTFSDNFEGSTFPQVFAAGAWNSSALVDGSGYVHQVVSGSKVAESHVDATGTRAELQCHRDGTCAGGEGSEFYYEYDLRIPSGQTIAPARSSIQQTKPSTPTGGGNSCWGGGLIAEQVADTTKFKIALRMRGGVPTDSSGSCVTPTDREFNLGTFSRDSWHHIALHAKWSTSPTVGFEEAWVDGVQVLGKTVDRTYLGEGRSQMFRIGIYITPNSAPLTFQYDNVRVGVPYGTTLNTGETLRVGESLWSTDHRYQLIVQLDGNLVEYGPNGAIWSTNTFGSNARLVMQLDGNLVLYNGANQAMWATNRFGSNARLVMQDDSNLVVYASSGVLWSRY